MSAQAFPHQNVSESLPHGFEGLVSYPFYYDLWWKIAMGLGGCLLLLLIVFLWRRFRRKEKEEPVPVREDPYLLLKRELEDLAVPEPFVGIRSVQFFFDLNMLFRKFIELGLLIPATDLTLKELKEPLRRKSKFSRKMTEDCIAFLERCDHIKFAGAQTDMREAQDSYLKVQEWVVYLRPKVSESQEGVPHQ